MIALLAHTATSNIRHGTCLGKPCGSQWMYLAWDAVAMRPSTSPLCNRIWNRQSALTFIATQTVCAVWHALKSTSWRPTNTRGIRHCTARMMGMVWVVVMAAVAPVGTDLVIGRQNSIPLAANASTLQHL